MTYARQEPPIFKETPTGISVRKYVVLSPRFVHGEVGEVIELQLTDNQELSLLETGAIERAPERPSVAENKKGEANA